MATKTDTELKDTIDENKLTKQLLIDIVDSKTNVQNTYGVYTPTLINVINILSSTASECTWMRVGDTVTVSGQVIIEPNATGSIELAISLPVTTTFTGSSQAGGVAATPSNVTQNPFGIYSFPGSSNVILAGNSLLISGNIYCFSFTYRVL